MSPERVNKLDIIRHGEERPKREGVHRLIEDAGLKERRYRARSCSAKPKNQI
jgi:hypothetical protein